MKNLRLAPLLLIVAILVLNPGVLFLEAGGCCSRFEHHCGGVCEEHGGLLATNCCGYYGDEECFCFDGYVDTHSGGTFCDPCNY